IIPGYFDQKNNFIYAVSGETLLRCSNPDSNSTWKDFGTIGEMFFLSGMAYDEARNILYAASNGGVRRCNNAEDPASWVDIGGVGGNQCILFVEEENALYAGTGAGVYKCTNPDSAPQWSNTGGGIEGSTVYGLVYDKQHSAVYADNDGRGISVWKYQDGIWTDISGEGAQPDYLYRTGSMVYDGKNDVLYLAGGISGIMRCDHPATDPVWTEQKPDGGLYDFNTIAFDDNRNTLFAGALEPDFPGMRTSDQDVEKFSKSKGVWICEDPLNDLSLKKMDGVASGDDISWLAFDSERNILYGESLSKGIWRYSPQ
ncbi:MAG: hypothetical protein JXA49_03115, partial [Actinobacteria bacterium]|nr:hypothetical protein [Actinomycetota bacterium]